MKHEHLRPSSPCMLLNKGSEIRLQAPPPRFPSDSPMHALKVTVTLLS